MYFAILITVLASLAIAETTPLAEVAAPYRSASAVILLALVLVLCGQLICGQLARQIRRTQQLGELSLILKLARWSRQALIWSWALLSCLGLYATQWTAVIRSNCGGARFVLLDELLIMGPSLTSLFALWLGLSRVERAMMERRLLGQAPTTFMLFALQVRHYGGFLFAPILFALLVGDLSEHYSSLLEGREWLAPVVLTAGLLILFPMALRRIWPTSPLASGPLRERLEETSRQVGMRVREILVWRTSGCLVNAAVVGFAGVFRYLMLTDALLDKLSDDDVESVLLHEAAHVRRRHLLLRLGLVGFPLLSWFVAVSMQPQGDSLLFASGQAASSLVASDAWLVLAAPTFVGLYCVLSLCWISRLLEFDADLTACRLAGAEAGSCSRYLSMLDRLAEASGARRDQRSWLHPSIDERMAMVAALQESNGQVESFERRLTATIVVFVMLGAAAPAWILFQLLTQ